ncbi:hypothetical protein FB451DRAFT_443568 [Mycena latifolia]|nr:hypothetical protein FB451DRAFT_443568 [Mycena latifolia]
MISPLSPSRLHSVLCIAQRIWRRRPHRPKSPCVLRSQAREPAESSVPRTPRDSRANHHARCAMRISHVSSVSEFVSASTYGAASPTHASSLRATPFPFTGRCTSSHSSNPHSPLSTRCHPRPPLPPSISHLLSEFKEEHRHIAERDTDYVARARVLGAGV